VSQITDFISYSCNNYLGDFCCWTRAFPSLAPAAPRSLQRAAIFPGLITPPPTRKAGILITPKKKRPLFTSCQEGVFSETERPIRPPLGNLPTFGGSETQSQNGLKKKKKKVHRGRAGAGRFSLCEVAPGDKPLVYTTLPPAHDGVHQDARAHQQSGRR
jgi:hypothetical protein